MNYINAYNTLVERARSRELTGYYEKHHVIPKCLGGSDDPFNLVSLTPEEHYLSHLLLIKIYPSSRPLLFAVKMMSGQGNNKSYGWIKRRIAEAGFSDDHKKKISESLTQYWKNKKETITLEDMKAKWARNEKLRQLKKDNIMITALIYSLT